MVMVTTPLFVAIGAISALLQKKGAGGGLQKSELDPRAAAGAFSNEVLISIRSVKAMPTLLRQKLSEYDEKLADIMPMAKKQAMGNGLSVGLMYFAFLAGMYPLALWWGCRLVDEGTIGVAEMFLCLV